MSSINDKIIDEIWSSIGPILNIPRVIYFLIFCLLLSSNASQVLNVSFFNLKAGNAFELLNTSFKQLEIWKLLFGGLSVFFIAPYSTFYINNYLIKSSHIHKATRLIEQLQVASKLKLIQLLDMRKTGVKKINFYKSFEELFSIVLIHLLYNFCNFNHIGIVWLLMVLLFLFAWLLFMYLMSQKILITFLTEIAPFNKNHS